MSIVCLLSEFAAENSSLGVFPADCLGHLSRRASECRLLSAGDWQL